MRVNSFKRGLMLWGRRLHLALALATLLPLVSLCLSGLALVYAPTLERWLWPTHWQVAPHHHQVSINRLASRVEQQLGQPVSTVYLHGVNEAWQMQLADGRLVNVDPGTGRLLRVGLREDFFYGWLLHWHRRLLTGPALQPWANHLLSATSLVLVVNLLVGLVLWLTPGARRKRLRWRRQLKPRAFNYQWHSLPALALAAPVALVALTGVSFHWPETLRTPLTAALNEPIQQPDFSLPAPFIGADQPDWDRARAQAQAALPSAVIHRLQRAPEPGQVLKVRAQMPTELHPYSWVWFTPDGGQLLGSFDATQTNLATRLWNLRYKIHIGDFAGPVVLASWLLVAALPLLLLWTGLRLWWLRQPSRARASSRRQGPAPDTMHCSTRPAGEPQWPSN